MQVLVLVMPQLGRNLFRFFKALKLEYFSAFSNDFEMQKATDQGLFLS